MLVKMHQIILKLMRLLRKWCRNWFYIKRFTN